MNKTEEKKFIEILSELTDILQNINTTLDNTLSYLQIMTDQYSSHKPPSRKAILKTIFSHLYSGEKE